MGTASRNDKPESLEELEQFVRGRSAAELTDMLIQISRRSRDLPDLETQEADVILGYDEAGTFR
jgi:hypothetical protein